MGDRFELVELVLKCPYCGEKTNAWYAESCGSTSDTCEYCKKDFDIEQKIMFKAIKKEGT